MRLYEFTNSKPLVIIDVQRAYQTYFGDDYLYKIMQFISKHKGPIIIIFNTETAGETKHDVLDFYYESCLNFDIDEEIINKLIFVPKDFGFLRNWMDQGVKDKDIIKVIRYMTLNRINDSREIPDEIFDELMSDYSTLYREDSIYLPDLSIKQLKQYQNCYVCGGGRHECFKEMTLLFNAFNIKYTVIASLVY